MPTARRRAARSVLTVWALAAGVVAAQAGSPKPTYTANETPAPTHTPHVSTGYTLTPTIVYPRCPDGFVQTYKTPETFICGIKPAPAAVQAHVGAAQGTACGSAYWNVGHTVHVTGTAWAPVVRWVCRHS